MLAWFAPLLGGLIEISGTLIGRMAIALGISLITYTGTTLTLDWLKSQAVTAILGLPAPVVGMLSTMKVGQALSIVFSAIVARMVSQGLTGDTLKKWVTK